MAQGGILSDRDLLVDVLRAVREAREALNRAEDRLPDQVTASVLANHFEPADEPSPCGPAAEAPPPVSPVPAEEPRIRRRKFDGRTSWSDEELAIVRKHYPSLGAAGCMPMLPGKSRDGIRVRAHLLGVKLLQRPKPVRADGWSEEEDQIIREQYPTKGRAILPLLSNRSEAGLKKRLKALGIRKASEAKRSDNGISNPRRSPLKTAPVAADPSLANARRSAAAVRQMTEKAQERVEQGLSANSAPPALRFAQRKLEQAMEDQARALDPVEQAKSILRRRYKPVVSMAVYGGPKDLFVVGTKRNVSQQDLLSMAAEMAA